MSETTDATMILAPLWRRKWLVLAVGVLVALATYMYYRGQPSVFQAKTQLYFGGASEQQGVLNNTLGKTSLSAAQVADQAAYINSAIRESVRRQLREHHERPEIHGKAHARANGASDFIQITAEAHTARAAARLADDYAQAYVKRHQEGYRRAVKAAIATTRRQLRRIEANQQLSASRLKTKGSNSSGKSAGLAGVATLQAATLSAKINQLESDLGVSSVQQVEPATRGTAQLIAPTPKRSAIFGFVVGIALAAIAAYAVDRIEPRLRSLADVETVFQTQVLAAIPRAKSPIVNRGGGPEPAAALLEPLRGLHTSLQLGDMLERDRGSAPRVILFLSADAGDGKSTLVADLALVQRDAGARVAVIEADLRRPALARLLSLSSTRGLAEVLAGAVTFEGALQRVGALAPEVSIDPVQPAAVSTVTRTRPTGSLSVLAGGSGAANPPALLASAAMGELLRATAADFDYVLIDAPPVQVSDAMPLLRVVDGIVLVARLEHTREAAAERLKQLLARSSTAPVLGVVANAVSHADMKRHGFFSSAYNERRWPRPS